MQQWRVLSLELDGNGLPKAQDIGANDPIPADMMKYMRDAPMATILTRYSVFRYQSLIRKGLDPLQDEFLKAYAPDLLTFTTTTRYATAPDTMQVEMIDTFAPPKIDPKPLRIMSWNLQDLGGGPSRGPARTQTAIDRIATVIAEIQPDICAILEVKLSGRPPSKPEEPVQPKNTRSNIDREAQYKKRVAQYKKDCEAYKIKLQEWNAAQSSNTLPGVGEVKRILKALQQFENGHVWQLLVDEHLHTVGEAYAFFYRSDAVKPKIWGILNKWEWPTAGYRHPARVTFELFDRCARPGATPAPFDLDVIAFHAPAPNHGEDVYAALQRFSDIDWPRETVLAGDFNIDTEVGDINYGKAYTEEFDPYDAKFDDDFDDWSNLAFNQRLDRARESFEAIIGSQLTDNLKQIFGDNHWLDGMDLARTSLRTSIGPAKQEHLQNGKWESTQAFQNAAYDKILLLTPKNCDESLLQPAGAYCYPLFERFLPNPLRSVFNHCMFSDQQAIDFAALTVEPHTGDSIDAALQRVLTEVKEISDHVPVVLELGIYPC